jgi:6-pyruvoyltetrahydropterin/6-carboxytetrahydropterin synthase
VALRYKPPTMSMRLERSFRFEAAHFLPRVPVGHKCARMHGHSYCIEIAMEGEIDHRVLNEIEGLANPTSELLARWLWERLKLSLPGLCEVVVAETPTSRCIYRGTPGTPGI